LRSRAAAVNIRKSRKYSHTLEWSVNADAHTKKPCKIDVRNEFLNPKDPYSPILVAGFGGG